MKIIEALLGPLETRTILIFSESTKRGAIIDPGYLSFRHFFPLIEENEIEIEAIYLTHSHHDHIADVSKFKESFPKALLFVHKEDRINVELPGSDGLRMFLDIEGTSVDRELVEGEEIKIGEYSFVVWHTPGHSIGSCVFYSEKEGLLISGDTLFANGFGRVDLPTSVPEKMGESLNRLMQLPKEVTVIPGHGRICTLKEAIHDIAGWTSRSKY